MVLFTVHIYSFHNIKIKSCSLGMSIKILCGKWPEAEAVFLQKCRDSLELMLESKSENERFENETANRCVALSDSHEIFDVK